MFPEKSILVGFSTSLYRYRVRTISLPEEPTAYGYVLRGIWRMASEDTFRGF